MSLVKLFTRVSEVHENLHAGVIFDAAHDGALSFFPSSHFYVRVDFTPFQG